MRIQGWCAALLLAVISVPSYSQIQRTSIPIRDAVDKALKKTLLTGENARPFHIRMVVSEPENPQSPYQGTVEEWWVSADQWRREVTAKSGMRQTIVVSDGKKTEKDEGDYFPLWLRRFVDAVFDPLPDAAAWRNAGVTIGQITMPNGAKSDPCARAESKIGTGDRATAAFSNVCFDSEGRFKFVGSPRFAMEFHDYHGFGKKQAARQYIGDPEPGTKLVGNVTVLEDCAKATTPSTFSPICANDDRFRSVSVSPSQLERLTADAIPVTWPPVRSGNLRGRLAMYLSIDSEGQVREAWPLNSDNAGLEDPARDQVMKWRVKPPKDEVGNPVQIDGGLGFSFETVIGKPLPVLSDAEARALAIKIVEPQFPAGTMKRGRRYRIRIAVDERGKVAGGGAGDTEIDGTEMMPGPCVFWAIMALFKWEFRPYMVDGKPQYFYAEIVFDGK